MRVWGWAVVTSLFLSLHHGTVSAVRLPALDTLVWSTRATCDTPQLLQVSVTYRSGLIYRKRVPVCQGERDRLAIDQIAQFTPFAFTGRPRDFAAKGADRRRPLEGRIWELEPREDALVLGVSVSLPGTVLLNARHVASPTQPSRNFVAPELIVDTAPLEPRRIHP